MSMGFDFVKDIFVDFQEQRKTEAQEGIDQLQAQRDYILKKEDDQKRYTEKEIRVKEKLDARKAKHDLDIAEITPPHSNSEILALFDEGAQFVRLGGLRAVYFQQAPQWLFINGQRFTCEGFSELGHYLCDQDEIGCELISLLKENKNALALFTRLVNSGYWYAD